MESTNSLLIIAPEAKLRIEEALAERGVPYFRVYIQGGGCSGYSYQFDVASEKNADDFEMTLDHGAVLVDAASATLLAGSTLNFQDELWNRQFVIENPNARQTCGCGASFAA